MLNPDSIFPQTISGGVIEGNAARGKKVDGLMLSNSLHGEVGTHSRIIAVKARNEAFEATFIESVVLYKPQRFIFAYLSVSEIFLYSLRVISARHINTAGLS